MTRTAELRCRCGNVEGRLANASPATVNRVLCYCDDCQAYLHHLGRTDLLDSHGGSDVVQVAPASLSFHRGKEHIVGLRLTRKGLHRWYANCCMTPLGNTVSQRIPFVGIASRAFDVDGQTADDVFGKPIGAILGKYAIDRPPGVPDTIELGLLAGSIRKVLGWRFGGKVWPHPFIDRTTGKAIYPVTVLSEAERDALRAFCGPNPSSIAARV